MKCNKLGHERSPPIEALGIDVFKTVGGNGFYFVSTTNNMHFRRRREKMKIKKVISSVILTVVLVTIGISYAWAQEAIKVGHVTCLTGPGSLWGIVGKEGLSMGLEDVNARGGIDGKKLEVIIYDSQSKPPVAATLAQRLIYEDKVPLILGAGSSLDNLAMMEVTERAKIPLVIAASASPLITEKGYKWVWLLSLTDKSTPEILVKYINTKPNWNRIAILHENTDFGRPPSEKVAELIKKSQGKELVAMESFNRGDIDISGQLLKIKRANPNLLITWGYQSELALISRQKRQIGLDVQMIGNSSMGFPEYIQLAGTAAEGDMFHCTINSYFNPDPVVQAFAKRYEEKFHKVMSVGVIDNYNSVIVVSEVLKRVGTDPEKIQNALNTMTFPGVACPLKFDEKGLRIPRGATINKIEGGKFKNVELFKY
jgi:branched-chain amino acid transport system substrate-binding protein